MKSASTRPSRHSRHFRLACVPLLGLFAAAFQVSAAPLTDAQKAQIDAMVAEYVPAVLPGLQLAVGRGGEVQYERGYGAANVRTGAPMTPATPVRIGSVTKQLTVATLLALSEQKKLSLQDPISRWLPEVKLQPSPTLMQVMQNVGGIPGANAEDSDLFGTVLQSLVNPPPPRADFIKRLNARGLFAQPGAVYDYSNAGYTLLGMVAERVTGQPLETVLQEMVFKPAGMASSTLPGSREVPGAAAGHYRVKTTDNWRLCPDLNAGFDAAGGVVSTASDQVRWNGALYGGKLLPAQTVALLQKPAMQADGKPAPAGMGVAYLGGPGSYGAAGQTVNFAAVNTHFGSGDDVVLLANGSNGAGDSVYPRFALAIRIHNLLNPGSALPVPATPPAPGADALAQPGEVMQMCR
ncbi:MAG: beta-lactamase family protein [Polaromonas sp.]|uniref:serine hydrolase domain-containing protein n=1 Tax=Polaromonas sp. TaxID=1869339 RepID=UPI0025FD357B|nr:serine hydrolase domain-containing protein [Polaromonas sp.]MBI2728219.1 beta-lactamase family protein [Polaromonas sp.]